MTIINVLRTCVDPGMKMDSVLNVMKIQLVKPSLLNTTLVSMNVSNHLCLLMVHANSTAQLVLIQEKVHACPV